MILHALILLCIASGALIDKVELMECKQDIYNKDTKVCMTGNDYISKEPELENIISYIDLTDLYESCNQNEFCNSSYTIQPTGDFLIYGLCTTKKSNGESCANHIECKSTFCVPDSTNSLKCSETLNKEGGHCRMSRDCDRDFACKVSTGMCVKRTAEGEDCHEIQCQYDYYCDFSNSKCKKLFSVEDYSIASAALFCKTGNIFPNGSCRPYSSLPLLKFSEKNSQFLPCATDGDCVYVDRDGKIADVGIERCFYASWTEKEEKYCRYGGGEDKLVSSMQDLIDKFGSEDELDLYSYTVLSDPVHRIDLINPSNCTIYDHIKNKYGSADMICASILALLSLII